MKGSEKLATGLWGVVIGAVGGVIALFSFGLITWSGSAEDMAQKRSEQAVIAALTPVCVANFKAAGAEAQEIKLAALEEARSYQRDDYVKEQGWATMPGSTEPNSAIAETCAEELMKLATK